MLPQITSHLQSKTVHSRLLLVSGAITSPSQNGDLWVTAHNHSFPAQTFPVRNSTFKALLHLSPGANSITLDFRPSALPDVSYKSVFDTTYIPLLQNPPLHLVIIVAKDSPLRYDDIPNPAEPATLDTAIKKLRMAGYLWQAYTESEINAQGLGHRTFRLDEDWLPDTLSRIDSPWRTTAKVTVIHSKSRVAHIRGIKPANQSQMSKDLRVFNIALEAIREHKELKPVSGQKVHVAAMFLDAASERGKASIRGHAAMACGDRGGIALAIFGSHALFAWPSCLEAVVPAFNDTRPVDIRYCGIDIEGTTYHMAANVGIGAFMQGIGHVLGSRHQAYGVMNRDYPSLSRSFSVLTPATVPTLECHWHRLDGLRFLRYPAFALPSDPPPSPGCISILPIPSGLQITSPNSPLLLLEFRAGGAEFPTSTFEPKNQNSIVIPHSQLVKDAELTVFSTSPLTPPRTIDSVKELIRTHTRKDPVHGTVFCTPMLGTGKGTTTRVSIPFPLQRIRIHSCAAIDGLEFFGDKEVSLLGKRGGSQLDFPVEPGEEFRGFAVRFGAWVEAVAIVMRSGRGEWKGGLGGTVGDAVVPDEAKVVGVVGELSSWIFSLGVEYIFPPPFSEKPAFMPEKAASMPEKAASMPEKAASM